MMERFELQAGSRTRAYTRTLACALLLSIPGMAMAQSVLWEDYRGLDNVPATLAQGNPGAPRFDNFPNNTAMAPFRALTLDPANAVRTGSSPNIDFRQSPADQTGLCNSAAGDGWEDSVACQHQAQGRVMYALIQAPYAGAYTVSVAHDDNLVVELSAEYEETDYRNAVYDIPVGSLAEWTTNDTTFATIGIFNAANPNSCALMRVYWTNQAGINHARLRWVRPNANGVGTTTEIIPASAYRDPSQPDSANGCNGSIVGNDSEITLNKVVGNQRLNANDQFRIVVSSSEDGELGASTTAGAGTGQQASTGPFEVVTGRTYFLSETMAAGSVTALSGYVTSIACTRNGIPLAATQVTNTATERRWSVVAGANAQIVCTITNTAPVANLSISKTANVSTLTSGEQAIFTIVARNDGPQTANNAIIHDPQVAGLNCMTVTCPAASLIGGATCPTTLSVPVLQDPGVVVPTLPVGGSLTLMLTCNVTATGTTP